MVGLISVLLLAGCTGAGQTPAPGLRVVATTSILGDVVGEVLGEAGHLEVLMEVGVDPHGFQPSAAQARRLREADLVVANGLGLEEGLLDVLAAAEEDGVEVLSVAEGVDPLPFALAGGHGGAGEGHAGEAEDARGSAGQAEGAGEADLEGALDPHFWLDPVRMATAVDLIAQRLAALAPDPAGVRARAEAYRDQVLALHEEIEETLAVIPPDRRVLVTDHDALTYLAARYGFEVVGAILPGGTTLTEASAGDLARLAARIEAAGVPAIFIDTTSPDRLARALSREIDARRVAVVRLPVGSLAGEGSGAATYLEMMRTVAGRIAAALGPDGAELRGGTAGQGEEGQVTGGGGSGG